MALPRLECHPLDFFVIFFDECNTIIERVQSTDLQRKLDEMETSRDVASAKCPHCGSVNLFSGFSEMFAFICDECSQSVTNPSQPSTQL